MLVLAHTGITLGAAALVSITKRNKSTERRERLLKWPIYLRKAFDVRILLVGSLLPDIIDKPLGQFFFRETFSNGWIFSHTLLFLIVVTATGFYVYQVYKKSWLLVLSFGTFMHLLLDQTWQSPRTLFWPIFGLTFEKVDLTGWAQNILSALFTSPEIYVPEVIGMSLLMWYAIVLIQQRKVRAFVRYGRV